MLPRRSLVPLLAGLLASLLLFGACSGSNDPEPAAAAADRIAELEPGSMDLVRVDFCDVVPPLAVRAALRGPSTAKEGWGNGDRPPLDDSATDLTHEFGCSWTRPGGFAARAWVFARPVTAAFADRVISSARARAGCTTTRGTDFGSPSMTQTCELPRNRGRVRHAGLFGDTWLTCEIAGPRGKAQPRNRADAWCARVASALDAQR